MKPKYCPANKVCQACPASLACIAGALHLVDQRLHVDVMLFGRWRAIDEWSTVRMGSCPSIQGGRRRDHMLRAEALQHDRWRAEGWRQNEEGKWVK